MGIKRRTRRAVEAAVSTDGLDHRIDVIEQMLATLDTLVRDGRSESRADAGAVNGVLNDLDERIALLTDGVAGLFGSTGIPEPGSAVPGPDEDLDPASLTPPVADFLNRATSATGYMARKGLWINSPIYVSHVGGNVQATLVNERIVEVPFVLGASERLAPGSRILDLGGAHSTNALSLASRGHVVTIIEPGGYPLGHPNLTIIPEMLEDADLAPRSFDMVIALSAIEHFGTGAYALPTATERADIAAISRVAALLTPEGSLVLTVPYGRAGLDEFQRVYDSDDIDELLDGWTVDRIDIAHRVGPLTWLPGAPPDGDEHGVAMVIARPPAS